MLQKRDASALVSACILRVPNIWWASCAVPARTVDDSTELSFKAKDPFLEL